MALFGYPVVGVLISVLQADSRVLSMPFRFFVVLVCIWAFVTRCLRLRFNSWQMLLVFVWAMLLARLLYDGIIGDVALADYALFFFLATVFFPTLALWSCNAYDRRLFAKFSLFLAAASCFLSLIGQALGLFGETDLTAVTGRLSMVALNPVSLGHLAASGVFCALVLASNAKIGSRAILLILVGLFLLVLMQTGSKSPVLALALPLLIWAFRLQAWGLLTLGVAATGILGALASSSPLASRIGGILEDPSTLDRVSMIKESLSQIFYHPWLGSSFVEQNSGYYPHTILLEAPMAFGLPLSFLVGLLLAFGTLLAWRSLNSCRDLFGLLFLQGLVASLISGSMFAAIGLWIPLALLLGTYSVDTLRSPIAGVKNTRVEAILPTS
jgi:hypothetical protein